ncbi:MAG: preprotein translocase subunit SecE [Candidatus Villigracilaceae bacterium]
MADKKASKQPNALQQFYRETMGELRKVSWPTWTEARNLTIIVVVVMIVMGLYLALIDAAASSLLELAIGL